MPPTFDRVGVNYFGVAGKRGSRGRIDEEQQKQDSTGIISHRYSLPYTPPSIENITPKIAVQVRATLPLQVKR
jgi:hypothetical protein